MRISLAKLMHHHSSKQDSDSDDNVDDDSSSNNNNNSSSSNNNHLQNHEKPRSTIGIKIARYSRQLLQHTADVLPFQNDDRVDENTNKEKKDNDKNDDKLIKDDRKVWRSLIINRPKPQNIRRRSMDFLWKFIPVGVIGTPDGVDERNATRDARRRRETTPRDFEASEYSSVVSSLSDVSEMTEHSESAGEKERDRDGRSRRLTRKRSV